MASDSFTTKCKDCKETMTFTVKKDDAGNKIENPEKPGKFKWNPPVGEDGEIHRCQGKYSAKVNSNCKWCGNRICKCKHTHCPLCAGHFGWFRDCTGELSIHLKQGTHYDNHGSMYNMQNRTNASSN